MNTPRKVKIKTKDDIRANLATKPKSLLSNKLGLSVEYLTVVPVRTTRLQTKFYFFLQKYFRSFPKRKAL